MVLCSRCKKNVAVVFIAKPDGSKSVQEGLCIKCASELGIAPINDIMKNFGINEDNIDEMVDQMNEVLGGDDPRAGAGADDDGDFSQTMTLDGSDDKDNAANNNSGKGRLPFFPQLFATQMPPRGEDRKDKTPQSSKDDNSAKKNARSEKKYKYLGVFTTNLTQQARNGQLDHVIGREQETTRVLQILNRRIKNNPCLIGEPGVGKTAIAEGLSQKIARGEVSAKLASKEIHLLDLVSLVAGTQFRGQFEARIKGLIEEVKSAGNIILVIDEVHNLVGAGDAEGSMNAANIIKPALSRGEIQVIGATTFKEYRKHIEKDSALERRFQPVVVKEPTQEQAVKMLIGIKEYYEKYHSATISADMCRQAVQLSSRYITDRFLPDKAIDLIDEAGSDVALNNAELARYDGITGKLAKISEEIESVIEASEEIDYEKIGLLRVQEAKLKEERESLEDKIVKPVTLSDLVRVIEIWTGIPAGKVYEGEYGRIRGLEGKIKSLIIGQDEAVERICAAVKRYKVGLTLKKRPLSFIFAGPTGVGKTELVRVLASELFDNAESFIRLDMSEYMEKHSVAKIIGSPPGYVGYDEAGQLTEKVRRNPYSVILFDEMEKAHPDVLNILLQVLDEGRITDAQGRLVNFENTVIVLTTNAGSHSAMHSVAGFSKGSDAVTKEQSMKALNDLLRPEFLNRIDEIVIFRSLDMGDFKRIADLNLNQLKRVLLETELDISWSPEVVDFIAEKAFSVKFGARNIRRIIQREVEDKLTEFVLDNADVKNFSLSIDGDKLKVESV